jgi:hypothetical protein
VKKTVPMTTMKHNIGPITMAVAIMYYSCPYLLNMYFGLTFNNTFSFPFCLSPVLGPHAASARALSASALFLCRLSPQPQPRLTNVLGLSMSRAPCSLGLSAVSGFVLSRARRSFSLAVAGWPSAD